MIKKISLIILLVLYIFFTGNAQDTPFKPEGKPLGKIFSNFHTTFSDSESATAFEVKRLYLGYEYAFSPTLSARAHMDIGNPGTGKLEMTAYLKTAWLKYQKDNLTLFFGMISTTQFKIQEKFWGYRYLRKSFQDEFKFNASADLGLSIAYKFNQFFSGDLIIANGEGYKKLENDSTLRTGMGLTIKPIEQLTGRIYYDFSSKKQTQSSVATFLGYQATAFSLGAEYNQQNNTGFTKHRKLKGISLYGTLEISAKVKVFSRYDHLYSNTLPGETNKWNHLNDGEAIIGGLEYAPVKGVRLAPNLQTWNPANNSIPSTTSIFFNCELKF